MPPISAWWPRLPTKNRMSRPAPSKTGVMTVTSGRCVPPLNGLFSATTSPGFSVPLRCASTVRTLSPIAPRCTGTCGAFATRPPSASKMAQEKSSRSLMFTLMRRVLQHRAGLFRHVHEQVVEQFQQHRIGALAAGGDPRSAGFRCGAGSCGRGCHFCGPAGLDHRGGVGLADQSRSGDTVAGKQRCALQHRCFDALRPGEDAARGR